MDNNTPKIKSYMSLGIILLINFIFLAKYIPRVNSTYYLLISMFIMIMYYLVWQYRSVLNKIPNVILHKINIAIVACFVIAAVTAFHFLPQESLNVDRWSVITSFWDSFFKGEYAYSARSHMGNMPGPMPFYFILALPFYLLGEMGYMSLFGILLFFVLLKYSKVNIQGQTIALILILVSAFYLWEVITRSNIFFNSSLILFSIIFYLKSKEVMKKQYQLLINGIIIGLLLSTRNVLVIPYMVFFIYLIKSKSILFTDVIKLAIITVVIFSITFVPFLINHWKEFPVANPFIIQSSFLMPSYLSAICIMLSCISFVLVKQYEDVFFYSGCFLFITITIYVLYQIHLNGFVNSLFGSKADISYFILCIPFLLYYQLRKLYTTCS